MKIYNKYLFNAELEIFLDEKNKIINKIFKMKKIIIKDQFIVEKNLVEINMVESEIDKKGKLNNKNITKKGLLSEFKLSMFGGGLVLLSVIGGIFVPFIGLYGVIGVFGGLGLTIKNYVDVKDNNKINEEKNEKIKKELNIQELIENEIIEYMKNLNLN